MIKSRILVLITVSVVSTIDRADHWLRISTETPKYYSGVHLNTAFNRPQGNNEFYE